MKITKLLTLVALAAITLRVAAQEPTPTVEEQHTALVEQIHTTGISVEEWPDAVRLAAERAAWDTTIVDVLVQNHLADEPVTAMAPYMNATPIAADSYYTAFLGYLPKDYDELKMALSALLPELDDRYTRLEILSRVSQYLPIPEEGTRDFYNQVITDFPELINGGWARKVFQTEVDQLDVSVEFSQFSTALGTYMGGLPEEVEQDRLRRYALSLYAAPRSGAGLSVLAPMFASYFEDTYSLLGHKTLNSLFYDNAEYGQYILLLRRSTKWGRDYFRKSLVAGTQVAAKNTDVEVVMQLADWVSEATGTDPLAGISYGETLTAALSTAGDSLDARILRGEFESIITEQKMLMTAADIEGSAKNKKAAAETVARVLFALTGSVVEPNRWLGMVAEETWHDYVLPE